MDWQAWRRGGFLAIRDDHPSLAMSLDSTEQSKQAEFPQARESNTRSLEHVIIEGLEGPYSCLVVMLHLHHEMMNGFKYHPVF